MDETIYDVDCEMRDAHAVYNSLTWALAMTDMYSKKSLAIVANSLVVATTHAANRDKGVLRALEEYFRAASVDDTE